MKKILHILPQLPIQKNRYYLIAILLNGFVSGLTFTLVAIVIPDQLADAKYTSYAIGAIAWARLPYSAKVIWAPFVDRYSIRFFCPRLGQRRGWAIVAQLCLLAAIASLNLLDVCPTKPKSILYLALILFMIALFGSIQDSIFEAYRIERPATKRELALAIAASSVGFRLAIFIGGVGSLYIASLYSWHKVYQVIFLLILLGPISILCSKESNTKKPHLDSAIPSSLPYFDTLRKSLIALKAGQSYLYLLLVIVFLFFYKASDSASMTMVARLFFDLSFSKEDLAKVKAYGAVAPILGSALGGILIAKIGILRSVCISGMMQLFSPLMFMLLALVGYHLPLAIAAMNIQYFCAGLASTVLHTYLANLCNSSWKATQFSILASVNSIISTMLSFSAGYAANYMSWPHFFFGVTILGILPLFIFPRIYRLSLTENNK